MCKSQPPDDEDLQSSEEFHKIELINFGTVVQTGVGSYFLKRHNSELDIVSLQYKSVADLFDQFGDCFDATWLPISLTTLDVSKSYEADKSDKWQVIQTDSDQLNPDYGDSLQSDSFYIAATDSLISQILIKDDKDKVVKYNASPNDDDDDNWGNNEDDLVEMFNSKLGL
ncbi:hypothetical protein MP228_005600 [Amoeboaphelidium protococcarum]|nr:hypothetical protein MP228_005600 [Amoeboaphelidium protococcarum]